MLLIASGSFWLSSSFSSDAILSLDIILMPIELVKSSKILFSLEKVILASFSSL